MRNLRIDELFIGAWVKRLVPLSDGMFSRPLRVAGLFDNGSMYLDVEDNDGDPFDAELKDVFPVSIDEVVLRGFGFVRAAKGDNVWMSSFGGIRLTVSLRQRHGVYECRRAAITGKVTCWNEEIRYIHELQSWWRDKVLLPYGVELNLEWRDRKEKEEF